MNTFINTVFASSQFISEPYKFHVLHGSESDSCGNEGMAVTKRRDQIFKG